MEKEYLIDNKEIMEEWNFDKNKNVDLLKLTMGSGLKVWWICKVCKYEWEAVIYSRKNGTGCPCCSNKIVVKGINDLATTNPNLTKEWNYEKNNILKPTSVVAGSGKKVWWICSKCKNEWQAKIGDRNKGERCPVCARQSIIENSKKTRLNKKRSLADKFPELVQEWHPIKNKNKKPETVLCGSREKVWWICSKGHEWQAIINNRCKGRKCPYCSNKKVLYGYNDLESQFPELMKEWNYEKNRNVNPKTISKGSEKNVWWKCEKGHEWKSKIYFRTTNRHNCPICARENQTSYPEQIIFYYMKKVFDNVYNRYKFDNYEIDVFIQDINVGIEYDGLFFHSKRVVKDRDLKKDNFFKEKNIKLYRVIENEECKNVEIDIEKINIPYQHNNEHLEKMINSIFEMLNMSVSDDFINIKRDRNEIMNNYIINKKSNSLSIQNPILAKEWNYEKNGNLTPEMFYPNSHKKVWWKCSKGHEWEAMISNRNDKGRGCPYCANQKIYSNENSIANIVPEILEFWDYEKNDISPYEITSGSERRVNFKCIKGHEFSSMIRIFSKSLKCPICSNRQILKGYNDLATLKPNLLSQWDYKKNNSLNIFPDCISPNSGKKVWWKCNKCGNEWYSSPNSRSDGGRCYQCYKKRLK